MSKDGIEWGDLCFKRMLRPSDMTDTLRPYGFNYPVSTSENTRLPRTWRDLPSNSTLTPHRRRGSGVVCLTRLWQPGDSRSAEDRQWRKRMNSYRVDLIKRLRANLGDAFFGGIVSDDFSSQYPPAAGLLLDERTTSKHAYIETVARSSIIVTTSGLHRSVGWRFGEAMSLGRAVVTEDFACAVPGVPETSIPWSTFHDASDALELIETLRGYPPAIDDMQRRAREFYRDWLRPDALVARTLV